jgi:hypothetical protein
VTGQVQHRLVANAPSVCFVSSLAGLALAALLQIAPAWGLLPTPPYDVICPLSGEVFQTTGIASSLQMGVRLDLRPVGTVPTLWLAGICPDETKFPIFKENFTDDELRRLREFVRTDEYKALIAADHPPSYVVAKLKRFLGYSDDEVAIAILGAAWATEGVPGSTAPWEQPAAPYLDEARRLYAKIAQGDPSLARTATARFLQIELSRRLGYFDEAAMLLAKYDIDTPWLKANIGPDLLSQEDDLIRHAYSRPARIGDIPPWDGSLIHFSVYPGVQQNEIERRVRIVFPGLMAQHIDNTMVDPVFDTYAHVPSDEWKAQLNSPERGPDWIVALIQGLDLRETSEYGTGEGLLIAHTDATMTIANEYWYQLCGYIDRRNSDGTIEHVEVNDGGSLTDIGGRDFVIADNGRTYFLRETTPDRSHVRVNIAEGKGCRDTPHAPPHVHLDSK